MQNLANVVSLGSLTVPEFAEYQEGQKERKRGSVNSLFSSLAGKEVISGPLCFENDLALKFMFWTRKKPKKQKWKTGKYGMEPQGNRGVT